MFWSFCLFFFLQVCQISILHNEEKFFTEKAFVVKVVQQLHLDFGDKNLPRLWTLQNLVSSGKFGQNVYLRNFFFRNECPTLSQTISVVWQENLGQGCLSYIPLGQWNLLRGFFLKNFYFCIFFGLRDEYLGSFGNKFLTYFSKLDSSFWKELFEEICTFWKKYILHEGFGTLMEKIEILYNFFRQRCKNRNLLLWENFRSKNSFFEGKNFFYVDFRFLAR